MIWDGMDVTGVNDQSDSYRELSYPIDMAGFDSAWDAVRGDREGERVSPELKGLLEPVYASLNSLQPELKSLKHSLEDLLNYLATKGRTNANCWAVDLFFFNSE